MQRVARAARGLVAAPKRDQARSARARPLADVAQFGRATDRRAKRGHRAGERFDFDGELGVACAMVSIQPISAAACRYQPTR